MAHAAQVRAVDVEALVAAIAALAPAQRRALQRRLYAAGLLDTADLLTDKHKLRVAVAVKPGSGQQGTGNGSAASPEARPKTAIAGETAPLPLPLPPVGPPRGKAVVGAPQPALIEEDPHAMPPLPGQAPAQPIGVIFDGGSRGNPGEGYGSYQLRWPGAQPQVVRLRFGNEMTNNEAEYDTLISALESILKRLGDSKAAPKTARVEVRGDSLLVINQVLGQWKCKDARMAQRRDRVRALLNQFGGWSLLHHDRENSVRALGH